MYTLKPLNRENSNLWDKILNHCPNSTMFHSMAWLNALAHSFKQLTPAYFLIQENDAVIGGLPAFMFQPIPGIKMLHSMPWNLTGGIQLIDESTVDLDSLFQAVENHVDGIVSEQNLCETRFILSPGQTQAYGQKLIELGYQKYEEAFTHLLKTQPDYNVIWTAYNKRVRGAVRKAEKTGRPVPHVL